MESYIRSAREREIEAVARYLSESLSAKMAAPLQAHQWKELSRGVIDVINKSAAGTQVG
jgi:hypothetical protein